MNKRFFLVWNPNGRTPRFVHSAKANALHEAERLAAQPHNAGERFYVLEATDCVAQEPRPLQRVELTCEAMTDEEREALMAGDGIPF